MHRRRNKRKVKNLKNWKKKTNRVIVISWLTPPGLNTFCVIAPCISQGSPEKQINKMCVCVCVSVCMCVHVGREGEERVSKYEGLIDWFYKLAHMIVEDGEPQLCRVGRLGLETQGRTEVAVQVPVQSDGRIPSFSEEASLFSVKAFNWLDDAHLHCGD